MSLTKAKLTPIDVKKKPPSRKTDAAVEVQFNPSSLRVSYSTAGAAGTQSASANAGKQNATTQPTSYSANLSIQLVFDTSTTGDNVRDTTLKLSGMMTKPGTDQIALVEFLWGSFLFVGNIQSMTETLDLFSESGVPLRATVDLSLQEQQLDKNDPTSGGTAGPGVGASAGAGLGAGFSAGASLGVSAGISAGFSASAGVGVGAAVGTTPLTLAQAGDTLQSLTARAGASVSWKAIATANDVENPRLLDAGSVLNLNASGSASASIT